ERRVERNGAQIAELSRKKYASALWAYIQALRLAAHVQRNQQPPIAKTPFIHDQGAGARHAGISAKRQRRLSSTQAEECPIERQHRGGIAGLCLDIQAGKALAKRKPRPARGEAAMRRTGPGKRRADRVAAKTETGHVALPRVANLIGRDRHIPHSDLFALVD